MTTFRDLLDAATTAQIDAVYEYMIGELRRLHDEGDEETKVTIRRFLYYECRGQPDPMQRPPSAVKPGTGVFGAVKEAVPVEDLAGRFTRLTRSGDRYKGCCPLHEERTASFVVYPGSQRWHCFGACARGGDVIELARLLMDKGLLT